MKKLFILAFALGSFSWLSAADTAAGKAAYDVSCKKCHGADGTPVAAIAKMMKVEMRHLGDKAVQAKPDAELKKETVDGIGKMKAMPQVAKDADNIVAFMRTLKK
ncbi:MAG: c-type cytochrome [Acidobacteriota bacterium]|jgi:mono/diheme cytochrome c family protein